MVMTPVPPTPATTMPIRRRRSRRGSCGLGQRAQARTATAPCCLRLLLQLAAFDGDEARAEALQAARVLVAGALVDGALAAELGLQRLHRQAVGLDAAVAAAFADQVVDDHAHGRIDHGAALAAAALFGGAGLVVDDDRGARRSRGTRAGSRRARRGGAPRRPPAAWHAVVLLRLVGDDHDLRHALGHAGCARSAAPSGPRAARRPAGRRSSRPRRCRGSCR